MNTLLLIEYPLNWVFESFVKYSKIIMGKNIWIYYY